MDSDEDMHDANDVDSLDDFYSGDTAMDSDNDDAENYEFIDNDSDDSDELSSNRQQVSTRLRAQVVSFGIIFYYFVPSCKDGYLMWLYMD